MTKLEEIQARADAATEGPWEVDRNYPFSSDLVGIYATNRKNYVIKADDQDEYLTRGDDATFIAQAREDVPKLVAALRAVEAVHPRTCEQSGRRDCGDAACPVLVCGPCGDSWPCQTIAAIREALDD